MGVKTLVLTGVTADRCILFTAADAYVRNYALIIPGDCVAAGNPKVTQLSLPYFKRVMKADIRRSVTVTLNSTRAAK
jgi:nicotinamidase-related amidase